LINDNEIVANAMHLRKGYFYHIILLYFLLL